MHKLATRTYLTLDGKVTTDEADANSLLGNEGDEITDAQAEALGLQPNVAPPAMHRLAGRTYLRADGQATTDETEALSLLGNEGDEIPEEQAIQIGLQSEPAKEPTRDELYERAVAAGLDVKKSAKKADLAAALEADAHEREQLLEQARGAEVDVDDNATTADIRAALEAANDK